MTQRRISESRALRAVVRGGLTGAVLGMVFLAGFVIRGRVPATAQERGDNSFALLSEAKSLLEENYIRALPSPTEMEYAAIRGYLGVLNDPYTFFNDPPVAQGESDVLAGQYGGIGAQILHNEQGFFVIYPFRDGPAASAGVQQGDILIAINGTAIAESERLDVIDRMLRGEVGEGRGVTILVRAPDSAETREYAIEFAVVTVPSVIWRVLEGTPLIGYIQILRFTSRTPDEVREALDDLNTEAVEAYVLDLRGNSGGLLQESLAVASEFLEGGVVFFERTRDGETAADATSGGRGLTRPLVVLVNGGTASAAELVAGAIRDRDRGILIGQQTYGKGSVQLIFRLSDGSSIHITSAEWFTPSHAPLEGFGLVPDIAMIPAEDGRDVELGEAIRHLRQALAASG